MNLNKLCDTHYPSCLAYVKSVYSRPCAMSTSKAIRYSTHCMPGSVGSGSTFPSTNLLFASIARGIDVEELFRYSSGRWLINEKQQLAQRYVKFDVDKLCERVASLFGASTVCSRIEKMEGSFNKAFLLTMDNGREVIAKVPCPNAGLPHYTTASEVATLELRMWPTLISHCCKV